MARLRVLVASIAAGTACVLAASPALAQEGQYPIEIPASVAVLDNGDVLVDIACPFASCPEGTEYNVVDANGNVIAELVAGADGRLRGRVRAAAIAALGDTGFATLAVIDPQTGQRALFRVNLAAAAAERADGVARPRTDGSLPRTGSEGAVPLAATGIALTMVGAGMVVVARRSRTSGSVAV